MFKFKAGRYACVATVMLTGCMAMPWAAWQAHEYEGDVAPDSISAVEDGRRVEFALVWITRRQDSPYTMHPEPRLVVRAESGRATPKTWAGRSSLNNHPLLERLHNESPLYRRPRDVDRALSYEPTRIRWGGGFIVATRPFAVAFPPDNVPAFGPPDFRMHWLEPRALSVRVNVIEILADADKLRVIRLKEPVTIDALLDRMATPGGLDEWVAEERLESRMLPAKINDSATRFPEEYPRL